MLGVGTPPSGAPNPLQPPEELWLWHTFLPWEVVVGKLSVCGGFQDCLEEMMGMSFCLSKWHGRADAQIFVMFMWKWSTWPIW